MDSSDVQGMREDGMGFDVGAFVRADLADAEERRRFEGGAPEASASMPKGGCPSNTHPQTSQVILEGWPECLVSGGLDWFEWSAIVDWNPDRFVAMVLGFERIKTRCQGNRVTDEWVEIAGLGPIRVSRMGVNRGGGRGEHYEFKIAYHGVTIGIANSNDRQSNRPNVFVQQKGRECLLMGAVEAYGLVGKFLNLSGAEVREAKLSRADISLDITGLDINSLQGPVERRQFITRARKVVPFINEVDGKRTGFQVGKRPLRLVVYDKCEEQLLKCDALYVQALIDRRWGGVTPTKAVRIEYQVCREWLTENGVSSPADYFQNEASIIAKLTGEWFRLTAEEVDRTNNHQGRAQTLPLWEAIGEAFAGFYGLPSRPLVPIQRARVHPTRLLKQARGCLRNALLQSGLPCDGGPFCVCGSVLVSAAVYCVVFCVAFSPARMPTPSTAF